MLKLLLFAPAAVLLSSSLVPESASANESCESPAGTVVSVQGVVEVDGSPASLHQTVCPGAAIYVGPRSRAGVRLLSTDTVIRIDQNSELVVEPSPENESILDLLRGIIHLFSREPRALRVKPPYINAAVEGTEFVVSAADERSDVIVVEGRVRASNDWGDVLLTGGDAASAGPGQPPSRRQVVSPLDSVQWAFHYPPIGAAEAAIESSRSAADLLAVGRVDEAADLLRNALKSDPHDVTALALQATIAVAQNRNEEAEALARKAVSIDPSSAVAYTALSLVQQANFVLAGAAESAGLAVANDANNAYAWARLAELQSAQGELNASRQSAQKAVAIEPRLSRTQTVLGFVHLARTEIRDAIDAFDNAVVLDQSDPLARLGLGLAKIRRGGLAEGRQDIEIAASLDPNNSLIRSYLGKAYFEEKRDPLDGRQYEIAKKLDPRDPTPWFYDAIRKQTINRPIEALRDLEKSIELNDNRAVYRSQLFLDSDSAARGASLARIYNDLGFEKQALNRAASSYTLDPANHSVHRFLSDTYARLPRHDIARDSELLQSQLLQPINVAPVRAGLADDGTLFFNDLGFRNTGFNEFSRLFARNGVQLLADLVAGNNSTFADNLVVYGIHDRFSYSVSQFHLESDGIRENNDRDHDIYNVFLQYTPTHRQSLQLEARQSRLDRGDTEIFFDFDNFSTERRDRFNTDSVRLGYRYSMSPDKTLLASYVRRELDDELSIGADFVSDVAEEADMVEVEYIGRGSVLDIVGGLGYFTQDISDTFTFAGLEPFVDTSVDKHFNAYLYGTWHLSPGLDLVTALSYDDLDFSLLDRDEINPKLGVLWKPDERTIVRAAALKLVKRSVISSQTIEPTQVAGFNQFFDDINGTKVEQLGVAVERMLSASLTAGLQIQRRELVTPVILASLGESVDLEQTDDTAVAYANMTIGDSWTVNAEVSYEDFDFGGFESEPSLGIRTLRVPFEVRYFHPEGYFAKGRVTYVDQRAPVSDGLGGFTHGDDDFWTADAFVGYRLKKRRGTLSLGVTNIFGTTFNFEDIDPNNPRIQRERLGQLRLTLLF